MDESWLDVTASQKLFGNGKQIADKIRNQVKKKLGLTLSAGVSFNKIFAKMGSDYKKPDATTVITQENYKNILWPLDIRDLFFVGKATADKLQGIGIHTIGQLAESDRHTVTALLGKQGSIIHDYANGLDQTPVSRFDEREDVKSIGNGSTFRRNLEGIQDIRTAVIALSDTVAVRLRQKKKKAFGVKVDIKDPSLKVISRQQQLDNPTNLAENIADTAVSIIEKSWNLRHPIRMLTVTAINLCPEDQAQQLSLFSSENIQNETGEKMERTMDDIRKKFGRNAITFGRIIKNDIGLESLKALKIPNNQVAPSPRRREYVFLSNGLDECTKIAYDLLHISRFIIKRQSIERRYIQTAFFDGFFQLFYIHAFAFDDSIVKGEVYRTSTPVFIPRRNGNTTRRGTVASQHANYFIAFSSVLFHIVRLTLCNLPALSAESHVVIQILRVPPSLDPDIQRFWAVHLLDPQIVFIQCVENFFTHSRISCQSFYFVVCIQQTTGYKNHFFTPVIISSVHS